METIELGDLDEKKLDCNYTIKFYGQKSDEFT